MKTIYLLVIAVLIISCSANQSSKTTTTAAKDCTESIKEYVINSQGLITSSTEQYSVNNITKQNDGTYKVQLRWESGSLTGRLLSKEISVDENCKVVKVK